MSQNTLGRLLRKRLHCRIRVALIGVVVVATSLWLRGAASAATIVVNDVSDTLHGAGCATTGTGTCSLRDAITFANSNAGADTINFNITSGCVSNVCTIALGSSLPNITGPVTIDGYTQSPATANTNSPPLGDNAVLTIEIDGTNISCCGSTACLLFTSGSGGSTVEGLVINRCHGSGIQFISTGGSNVVQGNFIGVDPTGTVAHIVNGAGVATEGATETNAVWCGSDLRKPANTGACGLIRGLFSGSSAFISVRKCGV